MALKFVSSYKTLSTMATSVIIDFIKCRLNEKALGAFSEDRFIANGGGDDVKED